MHRARAAGIAIVLSLTASACGDLIGVNIPVEFSDATKYFDAPMFTPMWAQLEQCSKLSGNLRAIGFYSVPRLTLSTENINIRILAEYFPRSNRIFVIESEKADSIIIRHEMMHALLRDVEGHPPEYFGADSPCAVF